MGNQPSWDFDGDAMVDLNQVDSDLDFGTPTFDYSGYAAGTYTVSVTATSAAGCSNVTTLDVMIYDAPVTPTDLSSTGDLCTNNTLTFSYPDLGSLPDEARFAMGF